MYEFNVKWIIDFDVQLFGTFYNMYDLIQDLHYLLLKLTRRAQR